MSESIILVGRPAVDPLDPLPVRLAQAGYAVYPAGDQAETLRLLAEHQPCALLVDIAAPDAHGIAICEAARAAHKELRILALNQGEPALRAAAVAAGADLVMEEPLNWADLRGWLRTPRAADGRLLAESALLGQTRTDVIGSAALLAHDLKSPISVIISSLEVLLAFPEEEGLSESTQRLLQGALSAAYRQLNLVSTLVDLPRLELNCYDLQLAPCDLGQIVRDALNRQAYELNIKGLEVQADLPPDPVIVQADRELIERALLVLIDNAIKFTVRGDRLFIQLVQEAQTVFLRFSDTGRPVQPSFEQAIMQRAPQWEHRQNGARTSVALEIPFVYAVARAHDGHFTATPTPDGKMTVFTLQLAAL
jgi:signal transduction histidine kinase